MIIESKQNIFDASLQAYGNLDNLILLLRSNNISLTDALEAGYDVKTPVTDKTDQDILGYYNNKQIKPATDIDKVDEADVNNNCNYCKLFE